MFVVTGGGSGIGRALAHALVVRGKSVLIVGRREPPLREASSYYPLIEYLCADVSTKAGRKLIVACLQSVPVIDGLIHNAGIIEPISPIIDIEESAWRQAMATNLEAPLFLTQALSEKLANGRVLHIGSGAAYFPVAGWVAYCVSKAALSMLTRCWQLECDRIAFASVKPGIVDTDIQAQIRQAKFMNHEKIEFFKRLKQEGKLLSPETVALFLCWLLLDMDSTKYSSKEWDIYDDTHHSAWLVSPHKIPTWE